MIESMLRMLFKLFTFPLLAVGCLIMTGVSSRRMNEGWDSLLKQWEQM